MTACGYREELTDLGGPHAKGQAPIAKMAGGARSGQRRSLQAGGQLGHGLEHGHGA